MVEKIYTKEEWTTIIAAASDSYEALVGLLEAYDVNLPAEECDYPDYWIKALQARAKAEGK